MEAWCLELPLIVNLVLVCAAFYFGIGWGVPALIGGMIVMLRDAFERDSLLDLMSAIEEVTGIEALLDRVNEVVVGTVA